MINELPHLPEKIILHLQAQSLDALQNGNQNNRATSSHDPILDPFTYTQPFSVSSHAGSTMFQISCASLYVTWDGNVNKFLPFLIIIKTRSQEIYYNNTTTSVANVNGKILFDEYQIITDNDLMTSKAAQKMIEQRRFCMLCTRRFKPPYLET